MFGTLLNLAALAVAAPPAPKMLATLDGIIYGVIVSPDGKQVAANVRVEGGAASGVHCLVYDVATGETKHAFAPQTPQIPAVVARLFSPDGKKLIGSYNSLDLATGATTKHPKMLPLSYDQTPHQVSKDGRRCVSLTTADDEATIQVWDIDPATMAAAEKFAVKRTKGTARRFHTPSCYIAADGKTLVYAVRTAGQAGAIKVVDVDTGKERQSIPVPDEIFVYNCAVSADATTIYAQHRTFGAADYGSTNVWDAKTGKLKANWKTGRLSYPRLSADGRFLFGGTGDKAEVTVFDTKTGKPFATLPTGYAGLSAIEPAPDGSWVAIAGGKLNDYRRIGIWKPADFKK